MLKTFPSVSSSRRICLATETRTSFAAAISCGVNPFDFDTDFSTFFFSSA